ALAQGSAATKIIAAVEVNLRIMFASIEKDGYLGGHPSSYRIPGLVLLGAVRRLLHFLLGLQRIVLRLHQGLLHRSNLLGWRLAFSYRPRIGGRSRRQTILALILG